MGSLAGRQVQLITHEFAPFIGGIGTYVEEMARAMFKEGAAVTVWAPDYGKGQVAWDRESGLAIRRVRMRGKQDWACRMRMAMALRREFGEAASGQTFVLGEPGPIRLWMYAGALRLPKPDRLALILHGSEVQALGHRRRFLDLLHMADRIGVVSMAVRRLVMAIDGALASKLVVIPGAVRSQWRKVTSDPKAAHRSGRVILQVGRAHPRKGQTVLLRALAHLPDYADKVSVKLVGPVGRARYEAELSRLIATSPIRVERLTSATDVELRQAYDAAEIAVMPSIAFRNSLEGLGLALLEAAHFGCAVVASDVGGTAEALVPGETGLIVPQNDPEALAGALRGLLEDPRRAAAMGLAGTQFVRARFSWVRNVHALLDDEQHGSLPSSAAFGIEPAD